MIACRRDTCTRRWEICRQWGELDTGRYRDHGGVDSSIGLDTRQNAAGLLLCCAALLSSPFPSNGGVVRYTAFCKSAAQEKKLGGHVFPLTHTALQCSRTNRADEAELGRPGNKAISRVVDWGLRGLAGLLGYDRHMRGTPLGMSWRTVLVVCAVVLASEVLRYVRSELFPFYNMCHRVSCALDAVTEVCDTVSISLSANITSQPIALCGAG